jgi:hypothetical protein
MDIKQMDCEELTPKEIIINDRDDFTGMIVNMCSKVNFREIFTMWIVFIMLHTNVFANSILSQSNGTLDKDKRITMIGTIYLSGFMVLAMILCSIIF